MRHCLCHATVNVLQTAIILQTAASERRSLGAYDSVKTITVQAGDQLTHDQARNGPFLFCKVEITNGAHDPAGIANAIAEVWTKADSRLKSPVRSPTTLWRVLQHADQLGTT